MKKIACIFLLVLPITAFAELGLDIQNQMLDSQIEKLTHERDSKYEALQKCEKNTKGFKIAGITTLVATGVGIYGNIKLSQKLKGKDTTGGGSAGAGLAEDKCAADDICKWDRECKMTGYKVTNCDHDKDCCAADGCPCEK